MNEKDLVWLVPSFQLGTLAFLWYSLRTQNLKHWKVFSTILIGCMVVCFFALEQADKTAVAVAAGKFGPTCRIIFGTMIAGTGPILFGVSLKSLATSIKARKQRA